MSAKDECFLCEGMAVCVGKDVAGIIQVACEIHAGYLADLSPEEQLLVSIFHKSP